MENLLEQLVSQVRNLVEAVNQVRNKLGGVSKNLKRFESKLIIWAETVSGETETEKRERENKEKKEQKN